ncbi:TIR domain-containing protein [Streptomyces europaeiscabiei]|uniref:TIR domain-containing protein n=1 Tax=Streptomyces europaeiscabiei TaxID=146819 RepID=UPI0029AF693A|nr:TIR domain-containing protein [Streptomyces europaeiscabiei]MDX3585739.1 trypsin-like peptidase domain-containing protein [Streptomyces europaeiscabiei]MDX3635983.1 trypsin-like peptidase domain-containing protein [Streptomyces europaeiscabiei]MDX3654059.1 trypsin-like peptidase domain-containing protein [Streptomyces europaeiscabiei]
MATDDIQSARDAQGVAGYAVESLSEAFDGPDLEAITRASAGMYDIEDLTQVSTDLKRRVALVEIDGHPMGTGVLVQPDVLLTAGHVIGAARESGLLSDNTLARFDLNRNAPMGPNGAGTPVRLTELLDSSSMTEAEEALSPLAWDAPPDRLDYALLRTDGPVPLCDEGLLQVPRGHYALDPGAYDFHRAPLLLLAHHPLGKRLQVTHSSKAVLSPQGTRVRYYDTNTLKGSSGGPVVDIRGRLVGLHTYTVGGRVNQGVSAAAIAAAVKRGPHPRVAEPAAAGSGPVHAPVIMLSWVEEDRRWAARVCDVLTAAGHRVLMGPAPDQPGHRTVREHVEGGGRMFVIVSPAYLADPGKTAERDFVVHDLDQATARSRLVPLLVSGEATGSLAVLSPVDLRGADAGDVPARVTSAVPAASETVGPVSPASAAAATALAFTPDDPLPRLQLLSERARRSAGTVSGTLFDDGEESQFEAGLYVTRDVEQKLLHCLDTERGTPLVVIGEPGCGKTSLLWSLARRRCETPSAEVFFLKATWLVPDESGGTRVDRKTLLTAIEQSRRAGRTVTVLIDTVDVLVNSTSSWETLVTVVDSAVAADAAVVVSSRVAEANELPQRWRQQWHTLSDYAREPGPDCPYPTSEFARAVLAHSRFFTSDPRIRDDVITRMLAIDARDISIEQLCLRPLTLRMLFEIYTPGDVPDVVDTTGLYEAYWNHRVVSDRRYWDSPRKRPDDGHDLSDAAMALALEMLRTGKPEARLAQVRLPSALASARFAEDVDLLVTRGVGQLTRGVFQFFHQTFFEYAASRALVDDHGGPSLRALVRHLHGLEGDDYFLLAVLEQAWLCAGRRQDCAPAAAETVGELLRTFSRSSGEPTALRYGLRRAVLSACAQSSLLTTDMLPDLLRLLGSDEELSLPSLNQFLALLPAPARSYGDNDIAFLRAASQRKDLAWIAVLDVLKRLLPRDTAQVLSTVDTLELVPRAAAGDGHPLTTRGELAEFLVTLLLWDPDKASDQLATVSEAALQRCEFQYVANLLTRMAALAAQHEDPARWARCADRMIKGSTATSAVLIKAHTAVLQPYLRTLDLAELIDRLRALVPRLLSAEEPATADRSLLGALLAAVAQVAQPPGADPTPVVDLLVRVTRPRHVTDLSLGALVHLLDSDTPIGHAVRDLAVHWLVRGMPTTIPESLAATRVKVVRQALEHLELPLHRVAEVAGRAATEWTTQGSDPRQVWQDQDCLRDLLVRGAAAGIPEARSVIDELPGGFPLTDKDLTDWVDHFAQRVAAERETSLLANLLLRIDEHRHLETLLKHKVELDAATGVRLAQSALAAVRTAVPRVRPRTMNQETRDRLKSLMSLLVRLEQAGNPVPLAWDELSGWIDRTPDPTAVGWLVELVGAGLERGDHPPDEALCLLRRLCGSDGETIDCTTEQGRRARRWCLWWYSVHGTDADVEETYRLAFATPPDAPGISKISTYVIVGERENALTGESAVDLLLGVGRRLKGCGLGDARRKNISKAWRAAMRTVVPGCASATHARIIRELPELDDHFAARVLQYVPMRRTTDLQSALESVALHQGLGPRLQSAVDKILDRYRRDASEGGWPHLFTELERSAGHAPIEATLLAHEGALALLDEWLDELAEDPGRDQDPTTTLVREQAARLRQTLDTGGGSPPPKPDCPAASLAGLGLSAADTEHLQSLLADTPELRDRIAAMLAARKAAQPVDEVPIIATVFRNTHHQLKEQCPDGYIGQFAADVDRMLLYLLRFVDLRLSETQKYGGQARAYLRQLKKDDDKPREAELGRDLRGQGLRVRMEETNVGGGRVDIAWQPNTELITLELKRDWAVPSFDAYATAYGPQAISYQVAGPPVNFLVVLDLTPKPQGLAAIPACIEVRTLPGPAGDPRPRTLIMVRVQGNKRDPSDV